MRRKVCLIGCIIFLVGLIITLAIMLGLALVDAYSAGNVVWKAAWIELIGMTVCAIGSGEFE